MATDSPNPGQGSGGRGIFSTPFGNTVTGNDPVTGNSNAPLAKTFDYGNATDGFDAGGYDEKGNGLIQGPGCANGEQKR
jgi:hypothetical protein